MKRPTALLAGLILAVGFSVPRVWPAGGVADAIGLVAVGTAAILVAMLVMRTRRQSGSDADDERRIRMDGLVGRATVLDMRYTGHRRGSDREAELRLEVLLPRRRRFTIERNDWLDLEGQKRVRIGQSIPVAADQAQPGHVVLALDMDEVRSIAGLGPVAGGPGGPLSPPTRSGPEGDR
jgi:hypothetical protein